LDTSSTFTLDCSDTDGWVVETETPLVRPIVDGVTLHSDGDSLYSSDIPVGVTTYYGGLFYYELDHPLRLGELYSFEVSITHPGTDDRMGWSRISLVDDMGNESIYLAQSDAWYETSTNSYAGFQTSDGVFYELGNSRSGSWTDILMVTMESNGDLHGDGLELLVESGNYDPNRLITHIAAYFGNKEGYNYESDLINNIQLEVDTVVTIDHPSDVEYDQGTTGHTIIWQPVCTAPDTYSVHHNGSAYDWGDWNGSAIEISIDDLAPGAHSFQIAAADGWDAMAMDEVIVTVIPAQLDLVTLSLVAGGGAIIIVVIVILMKKR
jgi:hypothetical protein